MSKSFKQLTTDEKLARVDRKLNLLLKVLGVKEPKPEPLTIDEEALRNNFLNKKKKAS